MNKAILAGGNADVGGSMQVNADTKICVFDLLGKSAIPKNDGGRAFGPATNI